MGVARRHDDRRRDLGSVDQGDAADLLAAARDRVDQALGPQRSASRLEGGEERGGYPTTATDWPPDPADVTHGVCQRAQPASRQFRGDAPHHRPGQCGRSHDRLVVEVRAQDICSAASGPAHQRARPAEPSSHCEAGESGDGRRLGCRVEDHANGGHGGGEVSAVAVDLRGEVAPDVVEGGVEVVVMRPPRAVMGARPREVVLGRFDVEVLQPVRPQPEFLDHRRGPERQVVAVADVDRRTGELLARCGASHVGSGFDQQRRHAGSGEVGSGHQPVVARPDHDGVVVGAGVGRTGCHGRESLAVRRRRRNVPRWLS